jgi:hypothetical protein
MMRILEDVCDTADDALALCELADRLERLMKSDEQRAKSKVKLPQLDKMKHITLHLKCIQDATPPPHVAAWAKIAMDIDKDPRLDPDSCLSLLEVLGSEFLGGFQSQPAREQVLGMCEYRGDKPRCAMKVTVVGPCGTIRRPKFFGRMV